MRSIACALGAFAGCLPAASPPAAPVLTEANHASPSLLGSTTSLPPNQCTVGAPTLFATTQERSRSVARCQVVAVDVDLRLSAKVLIRARSTAMITEAILHDEDDYRATWTLQGLQVVDGSGGQITESPDKAREVRALAAAVVGWPASAARRPLGRGQALPELEDPVRRIVDLRLRGEPVPDTPATRVRFRESRAQPWGAALVFEIEMDGEMSSAGMCHRWASETRASGELVLRADDGAVIALRLRGTSKDTEALCPEGASQMGESAEPKTCTAGEMSFDLGWSCSA